MVADGPNVAIGHLGCRRKISERTHFIISFMIFHTIEKVERLCKSVLHSVPWPMDTTSYQNKLDINILYFKVKGNKAKQRG